MYVIVVLRYTVYFLPLLSNYMEMSWDITKNVFCLIWLLLSLLIAFSFYTKKKSVSQEEVLERERLLAIEKIDELSCSFGTTILPIGKNLTTNGNECLTCSCILPPLVTCSEIPDCKSNSNLLELEWNRKKYKIHSKFFMSLNNHFNFSFIIIYRPHMAFFILTINKMELKLNYKIIMKWQLFIFIII